MIGKIEKLDIHYNLQKALCLVARIDTKSDEPIFYDSGKQLYFAAGRPTDRMKFAKKSHGIVVGYDHYFKNVYIKILPSLTQAVKEMKCICMYDAREADNSRNFILNFLKDAGYLPIEMDLVASEYW